MTRTGGNGHGAAPITRLTPLKRFFCDVCGGIIRRPEDGCVEWLISELPRSKQKVYRGFRIVHTTESSPRGDKGCGCHYPKWSIYGDASLEEFLGLDGLSLLLGMLPRAYNLKEFSEFMRRVQTPYYEEARQYWDLAKEDGFFDGASEHWPYLQSSLKEIIIRYGVLSRIG